jgi:hypothetical protein
VAGNKDGKLKLPVSELILLRDSPVASFATDTFAPGINAPPGSTTVPDIVPVVVCARTGISVKITAIKVTARLENRFMAVSPFFMLRERSVLSKLVSQNPQQPFV